MEWLGVSCVLLVFGRVLGVLGLWLHCGRGVVWLFVAGSGWEWLVLGLWLGRVLAVGGLEWLWCGPEWLGVACVGL